MIKVIFMLLGFAEDYHKILEKLELILTRSRNDLNAIIQEGITTSGTTTYEKIKVEFTKIEWFMPYVIVSDTKE